MDISALSESNFNASEWINTNFKKFVEENQSEIKTVATNDAGDLAVEFINSYVSKLQLYVQQVNYAVESTSQQIVASMPRITKDAKLLQTDVQELQKRMSEMHQEMAAVQEETGDCMASLESLNSLQCKLQAAKESLQESDGWGNLIAELEDCFERSDIKGVCEKLVALQKSLQAQEQLAGHAERQNQVEDFKNRLEALASPSVVQCFAEGNVENAQKYVDIFVGIQRLPQLQQYYRAVQKNSLQQQWKHTLELHATDSATTTIAQQQHFLTLFYDELMEHLRAQVKWCMQVFSNTSGELQPFLAIAELLPALQPTRDAHILQLLKTSNDRLDLLQQYAQANHNFVLHLQAFLEQSNLSFPQELKQQLSDAIFEYFYKFIQQYPRLEETQLSTQVDRLFVTQNSAFDAVHHLESSTQKLFEWLHAASQRCALITSDLAVCKMIALLGNIFKRLLENFAKTQRQLSLCIGGNSTGQSENWSHLQYTMSLLQCLADFQLKLHKFEKSLHERMSALVEKIELNNSNPNISVYTSMDRGEQKRLLTTIAEYQQKRQDSSNSQLLSLGIFPQIYEALKTHFVETHDITLGILLQPIERHLQHIQPAATEISTVDMDMPAFSYTPQECITQIGQYLLTLPQHLEPLLLSPSPLLKQALELCNIKYTQSIPCADILLSLVVEQCCVLYSSQVLQVKSLPPSHAKQMAVDIEYLSNVVEELGLTISSHLSQILTLLKASPDNYYTLSTGCEPRLVTAIRQMRNIISTQ